MSKRTVFPRATIVRRYRIKKLRVKLFTPHNSDHTLKIFNAGPGSFFTAAGIDATLDYIANELENNFPDHDYRLVPLGPGEFNFVWESERNCAAAS